MKTKFILEAIEALQMAEKRLKSVSINAYTDGDFQLSSKCYSAAWELKYELTKQFPEMKMEE